MAVLFVVRSLFLSSWKCNFVVCFVASSHTINFWRNFFFVSHSNNKNIIITRISAPTITIVNCVYQSLKYRLTFRFAHPNRVIYFAYQKKRTKLQKKMKEQKSETSICCLVWQCHLWDVLRFDSIQENGFWNILTKSTKPKEKKYLQQQQSHYTWLHYWDTPYALILISLGCCLLVFVSCVALSFNFIVICMLIFNTVSSILSWNCAGFNGIIFRSLLFRLFFFFSFILQITMNCTFGHFTCKYFETLKMYVTLHMVKHTFYRMAKHTVYPFKLNVFIQQLKTNANIRNWNFAGTFKYVELKSM